MPNKTGRKALKAQYNGQRGFIQLPVMAWVALGTGLVIAGLSAAVWVQSARLDTAKAELKLERAAFASFQAETKRLGDAANKVAREQDAKNKTAKEKTDELHAHAVATLNDRISRLRERTRTRGSLVPEPSPGAERPDRICFDRREFTGALQRFVDGVGEIAGEGAQAVIKLDSAKRWNLERK